MYKGCRYFRNKFFISFDQASEFTQIFTFKHMQYLYSVCIHHVIITLILCFYYRPLCPLGFNLFQEPTITMTTLPRLTTQETPVNVPQSSQPPSMVHRSNSKTFIGEAKGLSKSWDERLLQSANGERPLPRLNPLRPPKLNRTMTLETTDSHYQNDLRSLLMKREQYHKSHNKWMKPFYGSKVEQEDYR